MMAADIRAGSDFQAGAPRILFDVPAILSFDVAKDGRFLLPVPVAESPSATVPLTVLLNWTATLKN
jgi:hypothetical protein